MVLHEGKVKRSVTSFSNTLSFILESFLQGFNFSPPPSFIFIGTNFTLAELGICEPSPHRSGYCSDIGILHQGYSLSTGSDADSDTEGGMSPEHAIRLWGRGIKSRRSSGLSSRENSALTLTDSDNENKSDDENGRPASPVNFLMYLSQ